MPLSYHGNRISSRPKNTINSKRDDEGFRIEHNSSTSRFEKESREVVKGAKVSPDNKEGRGPGELACQMCGEWGFRGSLVAIVE